MSGKHVKVRAWRWGVGAPVVLVGIGLVAWLVTGVALVVAPHPRPTQLGGSTTAGNVRPGTLDPSPRERSATGDRDRHETTPAEVDASAQSRTSAAGQATPSAPSSDAGDQGGSTVPTVAAPAETADAAETEDQPPAPRADPPGKAKGHHKRPPRDRGRPS